jgi:hypothetical protein
MIVITTTITAQGLMSGCDCAYVPAVLVSTVCVSNIFVGSHGHKQGPLFNME